MTEKYQVNQTFNSLAYGVAAKVDGDQNIYCQEYKVKNHSMSEVFNNNFKEAKIANVANQVNDNARQQANQYNYVSEQKQTLAEAATEIQKLLKQLEKTNPTATEAEQKAFVNLAIPPTHRERFVSALKAGGKEALKEMLDNPYVNIGVAIVEGWQNP